MMDTNDIQRDNEELKRCIQKLYKCIKTTEELTCDILHNIDSIERVDIEKSMYIINQESHKCRHVLDTYFSTK